MSATDAQLLCHWQRCPAVGPYLDPKTLFEHLVDAHSPGAGTPLYCDWDGCKRESSIRWEKERLRHFRAHAGFKPYQCVHAGCGAAFCAESELRSHARRPHRPAGNTAHRVPKPTLGLPCRWAGCPRAFAEDAAGAALLAAHLSAEHGASSSGCRWAGCARSPRRGLKNHVRSHLPPWYKPFECTFCGETFQRRNFFTRHTKGARKRNGCITRGRLAAAEAHSAASDVLPPLSPLSILSSPPTSPASSPAPLPESSSPPSSSPPPTSTPPQYQPEEDIPGMIEDDALQVDTSNAALHSRLLAAENLILEMQAEIDSLRRTVQVRARTPDDDCDWSLDD